MRAVVDTEVTVKATLYVQECVTCAMLFAVPTEFDNRRRQDGRQFYCPLGHAQSYNRSEINKLREELKQEREHANRLARQRQQLENDLLDEVKQRQQLEKRIHAGTCPFCHRTFQQLSRHMANKHPQEKAS